MAYKLSTHIIVPVKRLVQRKNSIEQEKGKEKNERNEKC
jgi:hypothetical protein